jgi:hypothetical protein
VPATFYISFLGELIRFAVSKPATSPPAIVKTVTMRPALYVVVVSLFVMHQSSRKCSFNHWCVNLFC